MKLTFEPNLEYQQEAIGAVVGLFEGQMLEDSDYRYGMQEDGQFDFIDGVGNHLALTDEQILANLQKVQEQNEVPVSELLDGMHFSVEMETGTGKTYVYLRTIYELNSRYGFKKFVIVVPSVPIREGVLKNLQITHEHFQTLYDNIPVNYKVYDRNRISQLRGFATSDNIEILVINIDAFAKDENVINKPNDKLNGQEPIKFIQSTCPIVIVDEPQNMESEKRSAAIANLNPLCTLRYSATHRNRYNLIYSLNPVKAYDMGLVKQIEVDSVLEENSQNNAFVELTAITATKTKITAKITIDVNDKDGVKRKSVAVKVGDDLYNLSNNREIYRNGFIVEGIDASNGFVSFSNNEVLCQGQQQGGLNDEIMKFQIRRTIEEHLNKELKLNKQGIKVLSLFFIDRVANYRSYDAQGMPVEGKFAVWFEEIYNELIAKPIYQPLNKYPIEKIHNGYFSQDKKGRLKDTSGETQADDNTYNLIMKDKEMLLDINNPLRFIFSHTALREGWDNPNVFQICTLNETKSEMKKRQEIGRGLRLAVNQDGARIYDKNINRLTVVANEAYNDFAKALQSELKVDCGVDFGNRIKPRRDRIAVTYRKGFEADPMFLAIWEKLKTKTTYRVKYDTEELIRNAGLAIKNLPKIEQPSVHSIKNEVVITSSGITSQYKGDRISAGQSDYVIPDMLGYIQRHTELTRSTIMRIIAESGRINDLAVNPQLFMDLAIASIKRELHKMMIDGIEYRRLGDRTYEMRLFEDWETYKDEDTFEVSKKDKTIYDNFIPLDSVVENRFAQDCESSDQVKFYFKLPCWFKIPTPIGNYNPDWAVVFEDDKRIYFVAETKDTGTPTVDMSKLRSDEQAKIKCGAAHFRLFPDLDYQVVNCVNNLKK
ncbi:DEAD/DEAH box helicase family protein [uncultured Alistipes sp.]|uniref:restriction endonuclease n=1 Tax=uncultured Alistipes sp. TaxID=538949 RepID=UPI0026249D07|nr:DEAD/DEAH box helicase family protein [uncultured Alistipes sp.]